MFVKGPAKAVFPIVSRSPKPAIITAPGEITLNNGAKMEIKVIKAPIVVIRNSAHSPWRCAAILWAISCMRKEKVSTAAEDATAVRENSNRNRDAPTPITSKVPTAKCLSSVMLNHMALLCPFGGIMVIVCRYEGSVFENPNVFADCSRGALARQYSEQLWFSGRRCSAQKYLPQ